MENKNIKELLRLASLVGTDAKDSEQNLVHFVGRLVAESYGETLEQCAIPLIKYLCDNYHPHVTAIVTPTGVEVLSGEESVQNITDFLKD